MHQQTDSVSYTRQICIIYCRGVGLGSGNKKCGNGKWREIMASEGEG